MGSIVQRERIMQHVQDIYGVEPEYLWADALNYAVFRHSASKKWFGLIMDVPSSRLGLAGEGDVDIINVRCGPILAGSLLGEKGFLPAYHMNKNHWITILLNDTVSDDQISPLLVLSYDSVAPKRKARNDSQNK